MKCTVEDIVRGGIITTIHFTNEGLALSRPSCKMAQSPLTFHAVAKEPLIARASALAESNGSSAPYR